MRKHLVIPDLQVTPSTPTDHLTWIGRYIIEKKPDVIIQLGDFADMESLSSYDIGKRDYEGRRYWKDIEAVKDANRVLWADLDLYNKQKQQWKEKQYKPLKKLCLGNHEYRIERAIKDDPKLDGFMSVDDLGYQEFGWEVHNFLDVVEIDGVYYSHYFCNPLSGRPYGGENIGIRLKNIGFSFIMGHQQTYMLGVKSLNNGHRIRGLVQGACYLHDEDYRGPQGNNEWRGIFVLHEVINGDYCLMEVSLDYLCRKYEGFPLWQFMQNKYPDLFNRSTWMKHHAA
mgnify:CR=1 FL=1